ncbi:MAG: hypothetical protein L6R41_008397 [Letrouitia leprolyta]|nr:MAG: hypothetical protein L6R41_008397 [Letrouitia leprolyta]
MVFWKLQLKTKTKVGLCLLMGTTALAAICAIVKTSKLYQLADLADFTYGTVDLVIWAIVEANVIIIAACIPTLKPFVFAVQKGVQGSDRRSIIERLRGFRSYGYSRNSRHASAGYNGSYQKQERSSTDRASAGDFPLTKGVSEDESQRPMSAPPPSYGKIKRTTEIATEWETV